MPIKALPLFLALTLTASPALAADFQLAAIAAGGGNRTDSSDKSDALEVEEAPPAPPVAPRRGKVLDAPAPQLNKRVGQPDPYPAMLSALMKARKALLHAGIDPGDHLNRSRMFTRAAVLEIHSVMGNPQPLTIADDEPLIQPLNEARRRAALTQLKEAEALLKRTTAGGVPREKALRHVQRAIEAAELAH